MSKDGQDGNGWQSAVELPWSSYMGFILDSWDMVISLAIMMTIRQPGTCLRCTKSTGRMKYSCGPRLLWVLSLAAVSKKLQETQSKFHHCCCFWQTNCRENTQCMCLHMGNDCVSICTSKYHQCISVEIHSQNHEWLCPRMGIKLSLFSGILVMTFW